jgi:hypothetical protein
MAVDAIGPQVLRKALDYEHRGRLARIVTKLSGAGILLLSLCPLCSASTIALTCVGVGPVSTELTGATVTCPDFNLAGALSSMSIELDGSIMGSITLTNNSTALQTGSGATSSQFSVGSLIGFMFASPLFTTTFTTGSQTLGPSGTQTFSSLSGSGTATITNTTNFAPYIGGGTFTIPVSTLSGFSVIGGGGNFAGSQSTKATANALVTYTYDQSSTAPEPGTAVLTGGAALLILGLASRRRLVNPMS